MPLRFTDKAVETLAGKGFAPDYGARPLRRAIRAQVEDPLAEQLLSGALARGRTALVDAGEEGLSIKSEEIVGNLLPPAPSKELSADNQTTE